MDKSLDFSLLTKDQIEEYDNKKQINIRAEATDYCLFLGATASKSRKINYSYWWSRSSDGDGDVFAVDDVGDFEYLKARDRQGSTRPCINYDTISPYCKQISDTSSQGIFKVQFGEYPQQAVNKELKDELDRAFFNRDENLKTTGAYYTCDRTSLESTEQYLPMMLFEYSYNGKKYVLCQGAQKGFDTKNGDRINKGDSWWFEVQPVEWYVDLSNNLAISTQCLFSGIRMNFPSNYHNSDFQTSELYKYLNEYFAKQIIQHNKDVLTEEKPDDEIKHVVVKQRKTRIQKLDPDLTNSKDRPAMTDTELISTWIEAGQSVLLRGPSGIGKTERITTLYPDLIYIKLTNNMFPEKVVGSMNLQTGQNIPPDFAKQALLACATEKEKKLISANIQNLYDLADKIYERSKKSSDKVVIMLDELLNVKPAIQSLVYTIVLNKIVDSGKGLKLPANTVVVATGNQKKYSSVSEDLAEPLEKRFDHIYDMMPKVSEWLSDYAIPRKLHPAVIGYILSKYVNSGKSDAISKIGYFYEEPEIGEKQLDRYGCKGRTNDPRGWVSISNTMYAFEKDLRAGKFIGKNVEDILRKSINTKLREEWANEFIDFYNIPVVTVAEVMRKRLPKDCLPTDINERFACVTSLLLADETQVEKCRQFIRDYCDPEYLQLYDYCWAGNDENRMLKITELQEMDQAMDDEIDMSISISSGKDESVGKAI